MNDMVIPDTYCCVDSKSGATELIPFLIWQYYPKWFQKASGEKVKVVQFGWFNLYHMQNFEENQNIEVPGPDSSCVSCDTQNGVGIPGWGQVTISNWAGSNCIWTGFSRRF
jgi:hypothetical protein